MITVKELLSESGLNFVSTAHQEREDDSYDAHDDHIKKMFPGGESLGTQSLYSSLDVYHHGYSSVVKDKDGNTHHVISVTDPEGKTTHEVHSFKMHVPLLD